MMFHSVILLNYEMTLGHYIISGFGRFVNCSIRFQIEYIGNFSSSIRFSIPHSFKTPKAS